MSDTPNDMWAAGTVLFQLLMAGSPKWHNDFGPFMFGPLSQELLDCSQLASQQAQLDFQRVAIDRQHKLWVRSGHVGCQVLCITGPLLHLVTI